jgi:uncharacterized protein DUF6851/vanadium-dependent haloperoxidase-like protein
MLKRIFDCSQLWLVLLVFVTKVGWCQQNAVLVWNNAALQEIRYRYPGPTINARALAITHTCMFDAWAVYDARAVPTVLSASLRRPTSERTELNKRKAVSFAAYRCLADLFPSDISKLNVVMADQGLDPGESGASGSSPGAIGNLAAEAVLRTRRHDGSNQLGDMHPGVYSDYTKYVPLNDPDHIVNADHWQPLRTPNIFYGKFKVQTYLTPQWGLVTPFALSSGAQFRPPAPASITGSKDEYVKQAQEMLAISAGLTDEQKIIAEYWADGPNSETPPGHWCLFGQFVSARDHHTLDDDVKMFFVLTNALFDASIAAWDAKLAYDSVRPVTSIHYLLSGKPVRAWQRFKGTQSIDGAEWQPYQPVTMAMTPPFPEFVSGHSTFSAAAAEVLKQFTGSDAFGASVTIVAGRSKVEPGLTPRSDLTLSWPTFSSAADQAGMSRRYCGIHFHDGDLKGRAMGRQVAQQVWKKAMSHINGEATTASVK